MQNLHTKHLIQIHFAVFLFGMAGLFAKLISLPVIIIIFGRVLIASSFLGILIFYTGKNFKLKTRKEFGYLVLSGFILSIHWISFFQSIKISTVAIGLLTFSTFPVFTALLEPLFFKEKFYFKNIFITIIAFAGVALVVPEFNIDNNFTQGAAWGVCSGLAFSILSILNRKSVKQNHSLVVAFYQDLMVAVILFPSLFFVEYSFTLNNILLLLLLGIVFTAISHTIFINGLTVISVHTASIITCIEPIYAIIFAMIILSETPQLREIFGSILILCSAFYITIKSSNLTENI